MNIIWEYLHLGDFRCVFFEVRDQLARSYLPDTDVAALASRAHELLIVGQADGGDSVFVGAVNLPERGGAVDFEGADFAVGPARDDHLVRKDRAVGEDAGSRARSHHSAPRNHRVVVCVPQLY